MDRGKVVVIDDSPLVRRLAELALEEEGYKVYTAEDGEEGLKIAEEVMPAVILVDFIMPRMSGYQFCKMARESELLRDIPIILITGKGEDVGKKFIEKFAVADYFIKPFKSETLVEKVASIVEAQQVTPAGTPFVAPGMAGEVEAAEETYRLDIGRFEEPEISTPVIATEGAEVAEEPYRIEIKGVEEPETPAPAVSEEEMTVVEEPYRLDTEWLQGTDTTPVTAGQEAAATEGPYLLDIAGLEETQTAQSMRVGEDASGTEEPYRFDIVEPQASEVTAPSAKEEITAAWEGSGLDIEELRETEAAAPAVDEAGGAAEELHRLHVEESQGPEAPLSSVAEEEPVAAEEAYQLDAGGFEESGYTAPVAAEEEAPVAGEPYHLEIEELAEPGLTAPVLAEEKRRVENAPWLLDIEDSVERALRRSFVDRLPFLVQKGVADIMALSGIARTSEVQLQGQLACFGVSDLLHLIAGGKLTGRLFIYTHSLSGELYVDKGIIVSVSFGVDARQQVFHEKSGSEGAETVREDAYRILSCLFAQENGSFFFEKMALPRHVLMSQLRIPASSAVAETARIVETNVLSPLFQDRSAVFMRMMTDEAMDELGLNDDEKRMACLIEGRDSLETLIAVSGMEEPEVKRIMYVLTRTGAVKEGGVLHGQNSHS